MDREKSLTASAEERERAAMARALGAEVMEALEDPDITEVYAVPSGHVYFDSRSRGRCSTSIRLAPDAVYRFLAVVASTLGLEIGADLPQIQAELPQATFGGARLQGFVPPLAVGPAFHIRRHAQKVFRLEEYVQEGRLARAHHEALLAGVEQRSNILVVGPTGSGKTTFVNSLLLGMVELCPQDRFVILEDTVEIRCDAPDHTALRTTDRLSLADLVKSALRASPDRIIVGEVRDGAALHLLDAWATGHPGGCATLHASHAWGALQRLDRLAQRNNVPPQPALVGEAVDLVVVLAGASRRRQITEIVRVQGFEDGAYRLEPVAAD